MPRFVDGSRGQWTLMSTSQKGSPSQEKTNYWDKTIKNGKKKKSKEKGRRKKGIPNERQRKGKK